MILFSGLAAAEGEKRLIMLGCTELLDGLARANLWIADGTFKVCPTLFFQLYTIHFELRPGIVPAAVYCLVENKQRVTYERIIEQLKNLIPLASPDRILLDFEAAARSAFSDGYPNSVVLGCYFHLCQSVLRKVQECGMKADYENNAELRTAVRCLPALAMVPPNDVEEAFDMVAEHKPDHEKTPELLSYFEHTYIRGRRRAGRGRNFGPAIFPIQTWNHYESAVDGVARTTNSAEGWHFGLQSLFQCHHPTVWTFIAGLKQDMQTQKAAFLQGVAGSQVTAPKKYRDLKQRVTNAVERYSAAEILVYLRAISYLSYG